MKFIRVNKDDPAPLLDKEDDYAIRYALDSCGPSDQILLDYDQDSDLYKVYKAVVRDVPYLPADIFFSGNIPLMDCEITVDERGYIPNGGIGSARVFVVDMYKLLIDLSTYMGQTGASLPVHVGAIETPNGIVMPITVCKGRDEVMSVGYSLPQGKKLENGALTQGVLERLFSEYYSTWYAIQILLLNPDTKDIVGRFKKAYVHSGSDKPIYKRHTKYIKVHRVDTGEIKEALGLDEKRPFNRKTLAWYVIGHWRHYKDGRTIFIKGFWKGEMRHAKRNLDSGRDREIV